MSDSDFDDDRPRSRRRFTRPRNVVYIIKIEYAYDSQRPMQRKITGGGDHQRPELESEVRNIVEHELPRSMRSTFEIDMETKVLDVRYGSLTVLFSAALKAYPLIASYRDFFDSVQLIKKHCAMLLAHLNGTSYANQLDINVDVYYPTLPDPNDSPWRRFGRFFGPDSAELFAASSLFGTPRAGSHRDAFFWYLLVMNLVLIALVGSLVYRSVVSTYFERPAKTITAPAPAPTTAPARTTTR